MRQPMFATALLIGALVLGGCSSLPAEFRIPVPGWMRATPSIATPRATEPAAAESAALALPGGELAARDAAFRSQISQRFATVTDPARVRADLTASGFMCGWPAADQTVECTQLQEEAGCTFVYLVTVRPAAATVGEVRRRCPMS